MDLHIITVGEPVLRTPARHLTPQEIKAPPIQALIQDMQKAMYAAPGVGLAAPQVGLPLRLAVIEDKLEYHARLTPEQLESRERKPVPFHAIINPVLHLLDPPEVSHFEGCLSVPGFTGVVPRARRVRVECLDGNGDPRIIEASGWYARILQHEIDHLNATLYIDRMAAHTFTSLENYDRFWKDLPMREVLALRHGS